MEKNAIVVGAGLVGSLWSVYLSKAGYNVSIFERRSDIRLAEIAAGKSINLALSNRGWKALEAVGIADQVRTIAIPMHGRMMHDLEGNCTYQPYGKEGEAIYSVSRGGLNAMMMNIAEKEGQAKIHYNTKCTDIDLRAGKISLQDRSGKQYTAEADVVFGADGAYSAVRYAGMQKEDRFDYSQDFIDDGYKELLLPANEDGSYKIDKNCLHIWPRGRFMLIALPNEDGSFTCTLFMPFDGENSFNALKTDKDVDRFFKETFPDFYAMMPDLINDWHDHPLSSLAIMRCFPWTIGKTALLGDSAHATVPFYGQGMNSGFEDCYVMYQMMEKYQEDWPRVFEAYQTLRKPDGDAVQDLSLYNYYVMRDYVGDPSFLLRKKIEAHFSNKYPDKWMPLYSQVTFSDIRYSEALKAGKSQSDLMDQIMIMPEIESKWDSEEVEQRILSLLEKNT